MNLMQRSDNVRGRSLLVFPMALNAMPSTCTQLTVTGASPPPRNPQHQCTKSPLTHPTAPLGLFYEMILWSNNFPTAGIVIVHTGNSRGCSRRSKRLPEGMHVRRLSVGRDVLGHAHLVYMMISTVSFATGYTLDT